MYHDIIINFFQPFICFSEASTTSTAQPDMIAATCLKPAITMTNIVHQVLKETETLSGCHRAYQFQWHAAVSMIDYAFAYPTSECTPLARQGIEKAINVFDMFDESFAAAASVARLTRDLYSRINSLSTTL
jgi:hypothetical protein